MASYASDVKKELTSIEVHPEHAKAELAAFLRMNAVLSRHDGQMSLDIVTENPAIARRIFSLIKIAYGFEPQLIVTRKMKLKKNHQYLVRVAKEAPEIIADLEIFTPEKGFVTGIPDKIKNSEQRSMSYLRGAFLASGSVNNPETSRYHLEIYCTYANHCRDLQEIMNKYFDLNAKVTARRSGSIVYLKEAEKIGDFLHVVGAVNAMLAFEDLRIMRDMRNSVNRLVNCDTANLDRSVDAAMRQLDAIRKIEETRGLAWLPEKLQEVARLRVENPYISISALGDLCDPPLKKSGINNRLKKIEELAAKL